MLRLSQEEKERLQKVADELGINCASLRLSIRQGVNRVCGKLTPIIECAE
jgi:hypothetical protein